MNSHGPECFCDECINDPEITQGTVYCYGKVYCEVCGRLHGICVDFQNEKEDQEMINRSAKTDAQPQQRNTGRGRSRGPGNTGIPYLKQENVNFDKRTASVIACRVEDDTFKPGQQAVVAKIAFAGNTYLWTIRLDNPNLDILCDAFGDDEQRWVGKEFLLFLETDEFTNKNFIRVEVPAQKGKSRG